MSIVNSHPQPDQRDAGQPAAKIYPCDIALRERVRSIISPTFSQAQLARASRVDAPILSQYLNPAGNLYTGDTARYEQLLAAWLERRNLETLAGIPTIACPVSGQIAAAARMIRACGIMGKGIGKAGIGKTRGAALLNQTDKTSLLLLISRETGTREAVRATLFKMLGVRGPQKRTANRARLMYDELVKRLADAGLLLIVDQAHMLSSPAIDFMVEIWNATHAPQLWLGTRKLIDKLERDEQWGSRLAFTFELNVTVDKETNEVRDLVEHQIKSRLGDTINGELPALRKQCEQLALTGSFRRVEMRLATMLYLAAGARNKGKTWCELFEQSGQFLTETETDD